MYRRRLLPLTIASLLLMVLGLARPRPAAAIPLTIWFWKDVYGLCPRTCPSVQYLCPCKVVYEIPIPIL